MIAQFKRVFLLLLAGAVLVGAAACAQSVNQPSATPGAGIRLEDCQLSAPGLPVRMAAECGTLTVYEDRAAGQGRQIDLNIAVIPAVSRNPAPDPLFFITGGPGQAATESYLQLSFAFDRIHQKRDIVLVDQRGTGKSNPLACPDFDQPEGPGQETPDTEEATQAWVSACLEELDADLRQYTTPVAVEDLDEVRAALGYEQINLYGLSYGSRVAQVYLRQYPERTRAVILDGVVPQAEVLGVDVAVDAQRALDMAFERCENDPSCKEAFPDVRAEFGALVHSLNQDPVEVSLPHPNNGEMTDITFTADALGAAVRLLSYTPETVALLPLLIHDAHERNDLRLLAAQYLLVSDQLSTSISIGMNFSVLCAEDAPFMDREQVEAINADTYLANQQSDSIFTVCADWPRGEVPAGYKEPVRSDVPVLLLSGEADPVTPPSNGEAVAETLPNSLHLVAGGQGHNVVYRGCIPRIVGDFIENGSLDGLDTACVQKIQPMPFFTNFSGPRP